MSFFQSILVHLLSDVRIKLAEIPLGGGSDFDPVGQGSISQFPHEVGERNRPLFFRFFQRGVCIFQVDSIHLLPGQALQKTEILYRNDRPRRQREGTDHRLPPGERPRCGAEACHGGVPPGHSFGLITSIGQERLALLPIRAAGQLCYFPIQNVEKMRLRMSSAVVAPVMASMGRNAL